MSYLVKFFTFFAVNPILAALYLHWLGVPISAGIPIMITANILTMFFVYSMWGACMAFLKKHAWTRFVYRIKDYFDRAAWDDAVIDALNLGGIYALYQKAQNNRKSWILQRAMWLAERPHWVIYVLFCIPFFPYLPTICVIALKETQGKGKKAIMILATAFRTIIVVSIVYQAPIPDFAGLFHQTVQLFS